MRVPTQREALAQRQHGRDGDHPEGTRPTTAFIPTIPSYPRIPLVRLLFFVSLRLRVFVLNRVTLYRPVGIQKRSSSSTACVSAVCRRTRPTPGAYHAVAA